MNQDTKGTRVRFEGPLRVYPDGYKPDPIPWEPISGTDFYRRNNLRRDCSCPACSPSMGTFALVLAATVGFLAFLALGAVLLVEYSIGGW